MAIPPRWNSKDFLGVWSLKVKRAARAQAGGTLEGVNLESESQ
jgi:hypothetical protein